VNTTNVIEGKSTMTTSKQNLTNVIQRAEELRLLNRDIGDVNDWIKAETKRGIVIRHHTLQYRDQLTLRRAEVLTQLDPCGGDVHGVMR